jgi:hypothetical protein
MRQVRSEASFVIDRSIEPIEAPQIETTSLAKAMTNLYESGKGRFVFLTKA